MEDKTFEVTIKITVGARLADDIDLLEHRLSDALDFNTENWSYDITVDSLGVIEL